MLLSYNEFKKESFNIGDKVLIEFWYKDIITPVKILEKKGKKYLVSHNIEESKLKNAPDEWIKSIDIIDFLRK
jgi:hypothetical protein